MSAEKRPAAPAIPGSSRCRRHSRGSNKSCAALRIRNIMQHSKRRFPEIYYAVGERRHYSAKRAPSAEESHCSSSRLRSIQADRAVRESFQLSGSLFITVQVMAVADVSAAHKDAVRSFWNAFRMKSGKSAPNTSPDDPNIGRYCIRLTRQDPHRRKHTVAGKSDYFRLVIRTHSSSLCLFIVPAPHRPW